MDMNSGTFARIILVLLMIFLFIHFDNVARREKLEKKIMELELDKNQFKQEMYKDSLLRDSLYEIIDSLARSKKIILRSLKLVPVYIPGKFDTLKNEELQKLMISEYSKHK